MDNSVLYEVIDKTNVSTELEARNILGSMLISGEDVKKPVRTLSGGEKAKLKFANMMLNRGNILIMDEPTNHLDLSSKEVLDQSLFDFSGTLIMVSHDRYLLNKIPDKIVELTRNGFMIYNGKYDDYLKNKIEIKEVTKKEDSEVKTTYYRSKKDRAEEVKKQNLIKKTEAEIELLEEKISILEEEISSDEISSDYELLNEKCSELNLIKEELNEKYLFWEEINV